MFIALDKIQPGQVWLQNRPHNEAMLVHVLAHTVDMKGKHKIVIQRQFPKKKGIVPNYLQAQLVSPGYFYSLTVRL